MNKINCVIMTSQYSPWQNHICNTYCRKTIQEPAYCLAYSIRPASIYTYIKWPKCILDNYSEKLSIFVCSNEKNQTFYYVKYIDKIALKLFKFYKINLATQFSSNSVHIFIWNVWLCLQLSSNHHLIKYIRYKSLNLLKKVSY